jgi:hypothetical protein
VRRRSWVIIGAIVLVTVAAFVVVYFQPQKLLYDQRVDEALPTAGPTTGPSRGEVTPTASEPVELASGTFISREHETTGTARVVRLSDGRVILRFENFQTSNGPLLVVWLSQNAADGDDASFDDRYFALGALKGNVGDQNYVVPPEIDATGWTSVVVWCDRFNVSFGAADLTPSAAT